MGYLFPGDLHPLDLRGTPGKGQEKRLAERLTRGHQNIYLKDFRRYSLRLYPDSKKLSTNEGGHHSIHRY